MSSPSDPGQSDPSSPSSPHLPRTPDDGGSGYDNSYAAGRDSTEEIERAAALDAGLNEAHRDEHQLADNPPQPIDPALIAGGEDMVGIANDMTTGPDTMGANAGGEPAAEMQAEADGLRREGGNPRSS